MGGTCGTYGIQETSEKGFWSRDLREIIRPRRRRVDNIKMYFQEEGVAQWLRRCATNHKVAISIPDCAIGIFH